MKTKMFRALVVGALFCFPVTVLAQAKPATGQAPAVVPGRGEVAGQVRTLVQGSGMTPDQIRSRLKAEGYSEKLLDPYFAGASDSTAIPSDDVISALKLLGIGDTTAISSMRTAVRGQQAIDSAFLDTLARAAMDDSTKTAIRRLLRSRDALRLQADSGFQVFGLDLFQRETSQFDANLAGSVDANYRLGPGDRLVLFLSGDTEKAYPLEVTRDGFVFIPEVGQVNVAGLTLSQADDVLFRQLSRVYSRLGRGPGSGTRFSINVGRVGVNQIFVTGDVASPGSYRVSRAGTILNALYAAGGPTASGSMRKIEVHRGGSTITTLDVYDYALRGDASHDIRLENGDIIFVPPRGSDVRVAGPVMRPATYELKSGETLADVIRMAGGFAPDADRRRIQIERILPPAERTIAGSDRRMIEIASTLLTTGFGPAEPMQPGDIIRVFPLARRVTNRIAVLGNVWSPGQVAFVPGMRLSDALHRAGGLKPDSYLGQVLVSRLRADSTRQMIRAALRDTTGAAANDITLADNDEIKVFSLTEFRPQAYITINGAVKSSGRIPYREGMTLRDAVMLVGGLDESASLTEAEIARIPESRALGVTAITQRVPLDSSYVLGRSAVSRYPGMPGETPTVAQAPEVVLQPYDAVLIMRQTDWEPQRIVSITGEVVHPGQYALKSRQERLSDLIARAGGTTPRAYAAGATFSRKKGLIGKVGLDIPAVMRNPNHSDNLELMDGDEINFPTYAPIVVVTGAVNSPVAVAYVPGADIGYYINAAGGATELGDAHRAYVTQQSGKVETSHKRIFWTSEPAPLAGSTVTVPVKIPTNHLADVATIMTTLTSILGSVVAITAILKR